MRLSCQGPDTTHKVTRVVAGLRGRLAVGRHDVTGGSKPTASVVVVQRCSTSKKSSPNGNFNVGLRMRISTSRRDGHSWNLLFPLSLLFRSAAGFLPLSTVLAGPRGDVTSRPIEPTFAATTAAERSVGSAGQARARTIVWRARRTDRQGGGWSSSKYCSVRAR